MSLATFNFITAKRPTPSYRATPEERRRQTALESIRVQKHLLARDLGEQVAPLTKTIHVAGENGIVQQKTVERKPVRWYWQTATGGYAVEMQYARSPVLIGGPGKSVIGAATLQEVGKMLDLLAESIGKGDLDKALAQASEGDKKRKIKKAA